MSLAHPRQKFQDWFTQQWAILWGIQINPAKVPWLMGPFGSIGSISDDFVEQLAKDEGLVITRNTTSQGLIPSIGKLNLSEEEMARLSEKVVAFYKHTASYDLNFSVKWNPFFKFFGVLVKALFSTRIKQLNIPTSNSDSSKAINSEIITLSDPNSGEVIYTVWYRTFKETGQVIYSGVYSTCTLPSGQACVKAVFPLPKGNATVIMSPSVGPKGDLKLDASGKKFGDPGFYFLLNDAKGNYWSQYIATFRDTLVVGYENENILAEQTLTLWGMRVLRFNYRIRSKGGDATS